MISVTWAVPRFNFAATGYDTPAQTTFNGFNLGIPNVKKLEKG